MKDGIPTEEIHVTTISGTTAQFSDINLGAGAIGTAELADGAVTSTIQSFVGTGSPAAFGISVQAGSNSTTAGSIAWVAFGTPFVAAPVSILVSQAETLEGIYAPAGSWTAGSFIAITESASQSFSWSATGSGGIN